MPGFINKLAGGWKPGIDQAMFNAQFYNTSSPGEVQQLGNAFGALLGKGPMRFQDETGSVSINPLTGQLEAMGKNFGVGFTANKYNPSAEFKFKFGGPQYSYPGMMNQFLGEGQEYQQMSPAKQELEQQLNQYRSENPYWYRP